MRIFEYSIEELDIAQDDLKAVNYTYEHGEWVNIGSPSHVPKYRKPYTQLITHPSGEKVAIIANDYTKTIIQREPVSMWELEP